MDEIFEFILELIDNLTGNRLDYGIGRLTRKLTRNVKNEKLRNALQFLIWAVLFTLVISFVLVVMLLIEARRMGKL